MKRSLAQRGSALVLATVLNVSGGWLLVQHPAAGGSFDLDTVGVARAEALVSAAQPLSAGHAQSGASPAARPAGKPGGAARPQPQALGDRCVSICLPLHA